MNASDMGKKGSKKRWRGTTKKQRSEEMRRVALLRWAGGEGKGCGKASPVGKKHNVAISDGAGSATK